MSGVKVEWAPSRLRDKPYQASQVVDVLSKIFKLAEARGLAPPGRNPCRSVRTYRKHKRERFLTDSDCDALCVTEGYMWRSFRPEATSSTPDRIGATPSGNDAGKCSSGVSGLV